MSYTQADRAWAEWIAWELEEAGYRVLVQAWDFVAGSNWVRTMQEGVTRARRTVAVLSPAYLESVYGGAEWRAAWAADPDGTGRTLLTVRVAECDRPGLLGGVVGEDLFGLGETVARSRLRAMVRGAVSGRAKPATPPGFPGGSVGAGGRAVPRRARFPESLPTVWNVPARNPNFTGRAHDLDAVAAGLAAGRAVTVAAVHGMGGVGKTALVNEFAHVHATGYELVWWVASEQTAAIPDQMTRLAEQLGLDPDPDPERLPAQIHTALREMSGWLLVFDNADAVEDLTAWLPPSLMPPGRSGHVVVTTRRGGFSRIGAVVDLDVIDPVEAVALLRTRVPGLATGTAEEIAAEVGRLPLALEQVAAYLDRSGMPPEQYLALLRTRAQVVHRTTRPTGPAPARDAVASVFDLSLDALTADNAAAGQLLDICAYLAPEPIPLDLFTAHTDRLPEPLASAVTDELDLADLLAVIVDYSLAKRTPHGLQLHRLVQAALRTRHSSSAA